MPVDVCGPAPVDHGQRANRRAGEWCSARRSGGVRALSMVITTALLAPSAMKCSTSFAVQPQPLVPPSSRYVSYQPAVIVGSKIVRGTAPAVLRLSGGSTALGAKRSASPGGESDSGIAGMSMSASSKSSSPKKAKAKSPARSPAKSPAKRQATSTAVEDLEKARWEAQKAGDLEVLSTRESVLKRPDMWIGDVSTVLKMAWEVVEEKVEPASPVSRGDPDGFLTPMRPSAASDKAASVVASLTSTIAGDIDITSDEPGTPVAGSASPTSPRGTRTPKRAEAAIIGRKRLVARQREMQYNAGVLKTFDEIIVNSVDRQVEVRDMSMIEVKINRKTGELSVWNDGPGIEPVPHKSGKGLVPEVAFGEFMASTNFDDNTRKRFTGGRFGVGAKATNAWSKSFCVRTFHGKSGLFYEQTWSDNMETKSAPVVEDQGKQKQGWTHITWTPDYKRFGMSRGLDADTYACMQMRVYDLCACTRESIKVTLNGTPLPFKSLTGYANLFWGNEGELGARDRVYFKLADSASAAKIEVMISVSGSAALEARGLVNGVLCSQGTHIEHIISKLADGLVARAVRQQKRDKMKTDETKTGLNKMKTYFRQHMGIIAVALLPNPRFDGQTKEKLTLHPKDWGFDATIDDKLVDKVDKTLGLVDKVLMENEARTMAALSKKSGGTPAGSSARVSIAKYQGANLAGKAGRPPCFLLATEGDSAKDLAVAGMEIVGRDRYGVIPLRGVIRNVRPAKINAKTLKDFLKNAELAAINKVLGLQFGTVYTKDNVHKLLRYDHFVIFCDQDPDGAHIAGELINYFTIMFPSLLRAKPDFLMRLGTPIIRLKPIGKKGEALSFFTTAAYRTYLEQNGIAPTQVRKRFRLKYLKGLASSNEDDAHYYFQNLDSHLIPIIYGGESDDEIVDKWFRKNRADDRKVLLSRPYDPDVCVDYSAKKITLPHYFDREYIHFPHYAIYRTIPNVMDGFKPSQRKVMFTAFKRKFKDPVKVVQFAGAVLETAAYHHGDVALQGAIIAMARRYCGSNNINLLQPDGQFGSRHSNHAGAARYISAGLEKIARAIFRPEDDAILEYLDDDGQSIEPKYFLPVVPLALINGCEAGIAVGWSSFVPMYNPTDVIAWLRARMDQAALQTPEELDPDAPVEGMIDAQHSRSREASIALRRKASEGDGEESRLELTEGAELTADLTDATADNTEVNEETQTVENPEESEEDGEEGWAKGAGKDTDGFVDGLVPWYDGYHGETVRKGPHSYKLRGMAEYFEPEKKTQSGIIAITEVGPTIRSDSLREVWKERWGPAEVKDSKRKKAPENHQFLKDEQVYNTGVKVHIELTVDQEKLRAACGVTNVKKPITLEKLERVLGISETVSTTNMHLFDASMTMRRFATPEAMMEHYFRQRLYQYGRRKDHQVADLKARLEEVANRARYCTMVHDGSLSVVRKTVAQRVEDLAAAGFVKLVPRRGVGAANEGEGEGEGEGEVPRERKDGEEAAAEGAAADGAASGGTTKVAQASYDYLLRVPTLQCTTEFSARLRGEEQKMRDELAVLEATRPVDMWRRDLEELEGALSEFGARRMAALDKNIKMHAPKRRHKKEILAEKRALSKAEKARQEKAEKVAKKEKKTKGVVSRKIRSTARRANLGSPASKEELRKYLGGSSPTPDAIEGLKDTTAMSAAAAKEPRLFHVAQSPAETGVAASGTQSDLGVHGGLFSAATGQGAAQGSSGAAEAEASSALSGQGEASDL